MNDHIIDASWMCNGKGIIGDKMDNKIMVKELM
jgi:hypothetical protein